MLRIPRALLADAHAHAHAEAPREACGLLAGREEGEARIVTHLFRVRNAAPDPERTYLLDPEEMLRVVLHVEDELGLDVLGFYHSHPAGPARFSGTDAARASWPGASYLLVHLAPHEGHLAARWGAAEARFVDEAVVPTT